MNGTVVSFPYLLSMSIQARRSRMAKGRWATIARGLQALYNLEAIHDFTLSSNGRGQSFCKL